MELKDKININNLPKNIAIIMDGNGRWAKKKGKLRVFGHQHGVKPVRDVVEAGAELGIEYITLYAFSKENWNRPKYEVDALMTLLVKTIGKEIPTLNKNNIRLQTIGDISNLPTKSQKELQIAIDKTAKNTRMTLVLALSYGSRWEILEASKTLAKKFNSGEISENDFTEETFESVLNTSGMPNPELMIRTSGELRISNFLMWQLAYAELYFTDVLWPDFGKDDLYKAIIDYQSRERRFGKTSEQIQTV
ncbi:MAG: isoprenyl transferase [Bacteroidetes bacterium]|nr:MAG: isoprenyl transferase [Bacteroidota bacterium]